MVKIYKLILVLKSTSCYLKYGLVLFLWMLPACKKHEGKIALLYKNEKAIGIRIPQYLIRDASENRVKHSVRITLSNSQAAILGDFSLASDMVVFKPLIPLSSGMNYTIYQDDELIGKIMVPVSHEKQPEIFAIYPDKDTIPENTLKLYLHFSKPMRTGVALEHIAMLDGRDTMRRVFLDLKPELWDTSGTTLTLWLDPGRIKRGLVLNKKLGNPLRRSETYKLIVDGEWRDTHGIGLSKPYTHQFVARARDAQIPDIDRWGLNLPKAGTQNALIINTNEPLDHYLLQESVEIEDADGKAIQGRVALSGHDQTWQFTPLVPWKTQSYKLKVNSRLEDLAGNNLNRVFDRDITKDRQTNRDYYYRVFSVK